MPTTELTEVEQERRRRLDELAAEYGAGLAEQYGPGSFGCHELLDRTSWVGDNVEEAILNHPSCAMNPEWYALAEQAVAALRALYQRVGADHLDAETGPRSEPQ